MYRFVWGKAALNYLKDNEGLVNQLELAFADLRKTTTGLPPYGMIDEGIAQDRYIWHIYGHAILIRVGVEDSQPKLWIESIKPIAPDFRE